MKRKTEGHRLLREFLAAAGKSQRDLARGVKRSDPVISAWVTGKNRPDIESAFALERFTGGAVPVVAWSRAVPKRTRAA